VTIRSKLLLSYSLMSAAVLAVGLVSWLAVRSWQQADEELELLQQQGERAGRLQVAMQRTINYGLDFLGGEVSSEEEYRRIENLVTDRLDELKQNSRQSEEKGHIEGIEETSIELAWITRGVFGRLAEDAGQFDRSAARSRLREIADELADDVTVLNQYYRSQVRQSMQAAGQAGLYAAVAAGIAVAVAILELLALVFLIRRWLVAPMAEVNAALSNISAGDLETRIQISTSDEWGHLARSVNEMAHSLEQAGMRLRTQERFAALGEAAAYTAHNIRNPLAAIRAAAQVTLQELDDGEAESKQSLRDILQTVDRLNLWVNGFLSYAAPMELQKERADVNLMVAEAIEACGETNGKVVPTLADNLPETALDTILLQQVLVAVVTNSLEAGSELVEIQTRFQNGRAGRGDIYITVTDNGGGVAPRDLDKLFQAFATTKIGGTGLGLPQAQRIVELHGGTLKFESTPGEGSTVTMSLPIAL